MAGGFFWFQQKRHHSVHWSSHSPVPREYQSTGTNLSIPAQTTGFQPPESAQRDLQRDNFRPNVRTLPYTSLCTLLAVMSAKLHAILWIAALLVLFAAPSAAVTGTTAVFVFGSDRTDANVFFVLRWRSRVVGRCSQGTLRQRTRLWTQCNALWNH